MAQQPSCQSHLPSCHIHSDSQTAWREFGPGWRCRHGSRFKNRLRWKEEMETGDVRRQRQLEEESWRGKSTKQKKKRGGGWKQGHKVFLDEGERVRKAKGRCVWAGGWGQSSRELPGINLRCSSTLSLLLAGCRWRIFSAKWNKSSFKLLTHSGSDQTCTLGRF